MKNTIIIEFNGLPGSGKTTVSKLLKKELENGGKYSVVTQYFRWYWQRFPIPFLTIPYCPKLYHLVRIYSETILPKHKRTHLHSLVYFLRMYNQIKKYSKVDFALIDQAFIQDLVSIGWLDVMPHSDKFDAVVQKIKDEGINFVRVDCINNIELSLKRIKERPQIGHLFESIDKEELIKILQIQSNNFNYVRDTFTRIFKNQVVIKIDTQLPPEDNVHKIKDVINNLIIKS